MYFHNKCISDVETEIYDSDNKKLKGVWFLCNSVGHYITGCRYGL